MKELQIGFTKLPAPVAVLKLELTLDFQGDIIGVPVLVPAREGREGLLAAEIAAHLLTKKNPVIERLSLKEGA
jgi:hypothetical protein